MIATCMPLEPKATACASSGAGTSSAGSACEAGIWKALPMPSSAETARISVRSIQPPCVPAASSSAASACSAVAAIITRPR